MLFFFELATNCYKLLLKSPAVGRTDNTSSKRHTRAAHDPILPVFFCLYRHSFGTITSNDGLKVTVSAPPPLHSISNIQMAKSYLHFLKTVSLPWPIITPPPTPLSDAQTTTYSWMSPRQTKLLKPAINPLHHCHISISSEPVEMVESFTIDKLSFDHHTTDICKSCQQRLSSTQKNRTLSVTPHLLLLLYRSITEPIFPYCSACFFTMLTVTNRDSTNHTHPSPHWHCHHMQNVYHSTWPQLPLELMLYATYMWP